MQESGEVLPERNLLTGSFHLGRTKESFSKESGREVRAPGPPTTGPLLLQASAGGGPSDPKAVDRRRKMGPTGAHG